MLEYNNEWIENLILENINLRRENNILRIELEKSEKKHSDFVNEMFNVTTSVTNAWVNTILDGGLRVVVK